MIRVIAALVGIVVLIFTTFTGKTDIGLGSIVFLLLFLVLLSGLFAMEKRGQLT